MHMATLHLSRALNTEYLVIIRHEGNLRWFAVKCLWKVPPYILNRLVI